MNNKELHHTVSISDYDSTWATLFLKEKATLLESTTQHFIEVEHIGSTAIPNLKAKAIIDIMVAVKELSELTAFLPNLKILGYELIETDMEDRHFLRRVDGHQVDAFHLHIVSLETWPHKKERLMRDYLLEHPKEARAYGNLKLQLAQLHPNDSLAYTKAKTDFIQNLMNKACDKLGIEHIDVWND